jgi:hypothetical protein
MVWKQVQTGLVPRGGRGVVAGSSNRWWRLMTGVVVRVSVLSGVGVSKMNTGGRCEVIVLFLFLAVSFLLVCVEGLSRLCLRSDHLHVFSRLGFISWF